MPKAELKMKGLEKHIRELEALKNAAIAGMLEAALAGGEVIANAANTNLGKGRRVVAQMNATETTSRRVVVDIGLLKEYWYERFREYGTSPHEISPTTKDALRSYLGGKPVFSEGHEVGGVAADPFLRPAVDQKKTAAIQEMAGVYNRRLAQAVKSG